MCAEVRQKKNLSSGLIPRNIFYFPRPEYETNPIRSLIRCFFFFAMLESSLGELRVRTVTDRTLHGNQQYLTFELLSSPFVKIHGTHSNFMDTNMKNVQTEGNNGIE